MSNCDHEQREQPLHGGNVADKVVRIGYTVRKPATIATSSVEAFLEHLHLVGFAGSPRTLGRDERGRHVLEYIPGETVSLTVPLLEEELVQVGRLIRQFHVAASSFTPPLHASWQVAVTPDSESMICHHDLAPWNLVRTAANNGSKWVFIDWDGSGPGSPQWDLAYAARAFVPLAYGGAPARDALRLRSFVDGYGLNRASREALPMKMADRTHAMVQLLERGSRTGEQPWARLHAEGHAEYWRQSAIYVERHLEIWKQALLAGYTDESARST